MIYLYVDCSTLSQRTSVSTLRWCRPTQPGYPCSRWLVPVMLTLPQSYLSHFSLCWSLHCLRGSSMLTRTQTASPASGSYRSQSQNSLLAVVNIVSRALGEEAKYLWNIFAGVFFNVCLYSDPQFPDMNHNFFQDLILIIIFLIYNQELNKASVEVWPLCFFLFSCILFFAILSICIDSCNTVFGSRLMGCIHMPQITVM